MSDYTKLYQKFLNRTCSHEEVQELLDYFLTEEGDKEMVKLIEAALNDARSLSKWTKEDEESVSKNEKNIMGRIRTRKQVVYMTGWYAAAAALAIITLGIWLYEMGSTPSSSRNYLMYQNDIAPGGNRATLTLADGKVIHLDSTKTIVVIADSVKTSTMLVANTPKGGTYSFNLPDGTIAYLNAASSITFPSSFTGMKQRRVKIAGEAYFEVAKDQTHPFIVESPGQEVEVLGTHFNIKSYADEGSTKTTLFEGSISVSSLAGKRGDHTISSDQIILRPGQQSVYTGNGLIIQRANTEEVLAWKNGKFVFENETIESIMRKLSRWYDIDVEYRELPEYNDFSGSMSKFENISQVLRKIEMTNKVHFKIEGRRLIVMK